jgi:hypothetical protein
MVYEHGSYRCKQTLMVKRSEQSNFHQLLSQRLRIESLDSVDALQIDCRFYTS